MYHWTTIWIYYAVLERALFKLLERVDEGDADCLLWTGSRAGGAHPVLNLSAGTRMPMVRVPALQIRVGQFLLELGGKLPKRKDGVLGGVACTCGVSNCIFHVAYKTRSAIIRGGIKKMPTAARHLRNAKLAANHPRRKLTPEQVALIKESEGVSAMALAKACNVSRETVRLVLTGRTHRNYAASPWTGLGGL